MADLGDILDLLHESVFTRTPGGEILTWNKASEALYGWPRAAAVGRDAHELLGSAHERTIPALEGSLKANSFWDGELNRQKADGTALLIDARWRLSGDGGVVVETGRAITPGVEIETQLKLSEHRYRNLFQAMAASFWELDFFPVGDQLRAMRKAGVTDFSAHFARHPEVVREMMRATRVKDVNETTVSLYGGGHDKGAMLEIGNVEPYWPPESTHNYAESVVAAVQGRSHYASEIKARALDGRVFDAYFTACFPTDTMNKGTLLIGVIDLTELKKTQGALERLRADFAHAARVSMLGELTASIAHEVNQPLAAIATNASAGLRWLGRPEPDVEEVRGLTERIGADARRAADIIARVRAMAARTAPEQAALSVNAVIEEAALFLRPEVHAHQGELVLDLAADLPPVMADATQLQQVVANLAMNAVQAMGPQAAARRVTVRSAPAAGGVEVSVEDTGPGIPAENLGRLFDSFFTTKADGMGMGLAICRSILEAHGGTIAAANLEGGGARVAFTLPAAV